MKRFMKGIFELRPTFPKYKSIWDVNVVFEYMRTQPPIEQLPLKELTLRLVFLFLILSGKRGQTVHLFSLDLMTLSDTKCEFVITRTVKQTRVGFHIPPVWYEAYPSDPNLCVINHVREYLARTRTLRKPDCKKLLISYTKPHNAVSRDTISRWCKMILNSAGIDSQTFGSHSTQAASSSLVAQKHGDLTSIIESRGLVKCKNVSNFLQ